MRKNVTYSTLLFVFATLCCISCLNRTITYEGDYPEPVTIEMTNEDGVPYEIEAIEGQVCVWFYDDVKPREARRSIKKAGGKKILAQCPQYGYYLVEVPADEVLDFINEMYYTPGVDWVFPNMVSEASTASAYVLDNYNRQQNEVASHGAMVEFALNQYDSISPIKPFNIGSNEENTICTDTVRSLVCSNTEFFAMDSIAQFAPDGPIIINMSYGPPLPKRVVNDTVRKYYWPEAKYNERIKYKEYYKSSLRRLIYNIRPLLQSNRDFILVSSSGNRGVKQFDSEIISYLRHELEDWEIEILDDHLLLVSADETERVERHRKKYEQYNSLLEDRPNDSILQKKRDWEQTLYIHFGRYSNDMEEGRYDPWVTRVNLSDFKYAKKEEAGTSFASPRAAGILSSVITEFNISAQEALQLARAVTQRDGILTKSALQLAVKAKSDPTCTIDLAKDIVGQVIRDPAEESLFPDGWSWKLQPDNIQNVQELDRGQVVNDKVVVTAIAHLQKGHLKVDAELTAHYRVGLLGAELHNLEVHSVSIPPQNNCAGLLHFYPNTDFIPGLMMENTSDYSLFVVIDMSFGDGDMKHVSKFVDPYEETYVSIMGVPSSYNVRFAYRM